MNTRASLRTAGVAMALAALAEATLPAAARADVASPATVVPILSGFVALAACLVIALVIGAVFLLRRLRRRGAKAAEPAAPAAPAAEPTVAAVPPAESPAQEPTSPRDPQ